MFGRKTLDHPVLVVRESEEIRRALLDTLESATEAERPGLERALEVVAGLVGRDESELRVEWVHEVVSAAGVDLQAREVAAVKAVRKAAPGLSLSDAVALVREAREARERS